MQFKKIEEDVTSSIKMYSSFEDLQHENGDDHKESQLKTEGYRRVYSDIGFLIKSLIDLSENISKIETNIPLKDLSEIITILISEHSKIYDNDSMKQLILKRFIYRKSQFNKIIIDDILYCKCHDVYDYSLYSKNNDFHKDDEYIGNIIPYLNVSFSLMKRVIPIDNNSNKILKLTRLLKDILPDNNYYENDLSIGTIFNYICSKRASNLDISFVSKISKKIETSLINKNLFSNTIYILLKWIEIAFSKSNINSSKICTFNGTLDLYFNSIFQLLILLFIKSKNNELLNKLYQIDKTNFNNIETLNHLAAYYSEIGNYNSYKTILDSLKILDPYSINIENYNSTLSRLKAIKNLSDNFDYKNINNLSGIEFEEMIKNKFIYLSFKAKTTKASGDYGADIIIETINSTRIAIQCKRFRNKVNLKAVQEVNSAISHYGCDFGIVITNNTFLKSAVTLAKSNDIELWDNSKLLRFLTNDISFSCITEL